MRLSITEHHCGDAEIVVITGDIDMSTSPQVWEALHRCLATHVALLMVDLTAVTFLGSSGLKLLARTARAPYTALRVAAHQRAVLRPIQITGLDQVLALFDTVEQAWASA